MRRYDEGRPLKLRERRTLRQRDGAARAGAASRVMQRTAAAAAGVGGGEVGAKRETAVGEWRAWEGKREREAVSERV